MAERDMLSVFYSLHWSLIPPKTLSIEPDLVTSSRQSVSAWRKFPASGVTIKGTYCSQSESGNQQHHSWLSQETAVELSFYRADLGTSRMVADRN